MKNYKQILEAINRGILLALDDFEDVEQVLHVKSKQVQNRDYTKEYLDLMEEVVDLGLPSGTLWCKYNLGVDLNLLSKAKDWYGDYYAWGELELNKPEYDWDHYEHGYGPYDLYKYVINKEYADDNDNKVDNLTKLLPEDDVAYQKKKLYNFKFHIPTKELYEELINYTNNYWINNYDPNKLVHNPDDKGIQGLNGRVFIGLNGNQLFIPAAGYRYGSHINVGGSVCNTWSSSLDLDDSNCANSLYFNSHNIYVDVDYCDRGCSIRPVINL